MPKPRPTPRNRPARPSARPGSPNRRPGPGGLGDRPKSRPTGSRPTPHSRPRPKPQTDRSQIARPSSGPGPGQNKKGVRLQRVMADSGVASRRECEQMIEDGRVEVNGERITRLPVFVNPATDRILVDGRHLSREETTQHRIYVMLNKPDNTLGTTKDELEYKKGGRRTVADLVKHHSGARLFPVGRLDFHSTGLVLMTNDGTLADRLTHARYGVTKTYRVWIHGSVPVEILDMLRRRVGKREAPQGGVRIITDDDNLPSRQRRPSAPTNMTVLEIDAREGRTEPLGEMLVTAGCRLKRIARIAIGPLRLMGVSPGDWRDLTKDEVRTLKEAAGLIRTTPTAHVARPDRPDRPTGGRLSSEQTPMNPQRSDTPKPYEKKGAASRSSEVPE